ncbi:metallophosphoesterase [Candidatus Woesearchaeota archaeon]|nr:metallophosphoesterase [Candidatus Woesearchaeota archaeon]
MKVLAFTDVHGDKRAIKSIIESAKLDNPDLLVCAGDASNFGENLDLILKELKTTKKSIIIIPGNHEDKEELEKICNKFENCIYLHKRTYKIGNYFFIGFGGGGFSTRDFEFEEFVNKKKEEISKEHKIILITHGPVYGTKVDLIPGLGHRGCKSYRKFIDKFKPIIVICGHFHEAAGKLDEIDRSLIINPGKLGKVLEF